MLAYRVPRIPRRATPSPQSPVLSPPLAILYFLSAAVSKSAQTRPKLRFSIHTHFTLHISHFTPAPCNLNNLKHSLHTHPLHFVFPTVPSVPTLPYAVTALAPRTWHLAPVHFALLPSPIHNSLERIFQNSSTLTTRQSASACSTAAPNSALSKLSFSFSFSFSFPAPRELKLLNLIGLMKLEI